MPENLNGHKDPALLVWNNLCSEISIDEVTPQQVAYVADLILNLQQLHPSWTALVYAGYKSEFAKEHPQAVEQWPSIATALAEFVATHPLEVK